MLNLLKVIINLLLFLIRSLVTDRHDLNAVVVIVVMVANVIFMKPIFLIRVLMKVIQVIHQLYLLPVLHVVLLEEAVGAVFVPGVVVVPGAWAVLKFVVVPVPQVAQEFVVVAEFVPAVVVMDAVLVLVVVLVAVVAGVEGKSTIKNYRLRKRKMT